MRSSMMHVGLGRAALAAAAILAVAAPVAADWLVTRGEGGAAAQVETRGPWEVKGRLVVFHTTEGQLASLRLDQVDLEASSEATRQAEEAARRQSEPVAEPPPRAPSPRRRITDADIPRGTSVPPPAAEEEAEAGEPAAGTGEGRGTAETLVVLASSVTETADGHARITGTLANHGAEPAVALALAVELYDVDGELISSRAAELSSSALTPGDVTSFVADFPDVFAYAATRFEPRGTRLATSAPESAPEPGSEDDGGGR